MKVNLSVDSDEPVPLRNLDFASCVLERNLGLLWSDDIKKPEEAEISLIFLSPQDMKEQNALFREIDEPTDVLSFPLWEEEGRFIPQPQLPVIPLGDILICTEQVLANAQKNGIPFCDELCLVLAHGFLHLLAYDHDTPEREAEMWKLQDDIKEELLKGEQIV